MTAARAPAISVSGSPGRPAANEAEGTSGVEYRVWWSRRSILICKPAGLPHTEDTEDTEINPVSSVPSVSGQVFSGILDQRFSQ
jgi:hypothetical protein